MITNNYTVLYRIHLFLALFVLVLYGSVLIFDYQSLTSAGKKYIPVIMIVVPTLLFSIAIACKKQLNVGRSASKVVGVLLLPLVPFGTVLGLTMLQKTKKSVNTHPENVNSRKTESDNNFG